MKIKKREKIAEHSDGPTPESMPALEFVPGSLVRVVDDNGHVLDQVCLYVGLSIPADAGLGIEDLMDDIQFVDERFKTTSPTNRSSHFFYTLPSHWHHALFVGDRIVYLNAGFYTVISVEAV
jgi:hypothetical protein